MAKATETWKKRTIVTSALPYIHGVPHLGNIVGSILPADIYHRFLDIAGVENIFICGSDEHGTPLELAALKAGVPTEQYANEQHKNVKEVLEQFNMDFSLYGRTHTSYNKKQTHAMFKALYRNGYITEKTQNLPHCNKCDRFLAERYIEGECPHCGGFARGDQCDEQTCGKLLEPKEIVNPYCTICGERDIEFRTTKHLFVQLPKFVSELQEWLASSAPIPKHAKQEVLNLLDEGLEDRCITRDIDWGFPVPTEEFDDLDDDVYKDKVLYVWFDAPIGYISITQQYCAEKHDDESAWASWWKHGDASTIYSLGKDNTIFHTIIWPSLLLGQEDDYTLPDYEFIHQYLLSGEVQFSKSRGTGLTSEKALDLLPADYWRFYLASVLPRQHDSRFSWEDFEAKINGELNDTVGNFVNRVLSLAEQWFDNRVPPVTAHDINDRTAAFLTTIRDHVLAYEQAIAVEKNLKEGVQHAVKIARAGDEFLSAEEPWHNENVREDVIFGCLQAVNALAVVLYPYVPEAAETIWSMLNLDEELVNGDDRVAQLKEHEHFLPAGHTLGEKELLFKKVDSERLKKAVAEENTDKEREETMSDTISFDEFQKMDLRVGRVSKVLEHPDADKLYLLAVEIGDETKQAVAGLKEYLEPEEIEGKRVIVVNNLETAEIRGAKSQCMVLAAEDDGELTLLTTTSDIPSGTKVR